MKAPSGEQECHLLHSYKSTPQKNVPDSVKENNQSSEIGKVLSPCDSSKEVNCCVWRGSFIRLCSLANNLTFQMFRDIQIHTLHIIFSHHNLLHLQEQYIQTWKKVPDTKIRKCEFPDSSTELFLYSHLCIKISAVLQRKISCSCIYSISKSWNLQQVNYRKYSILKKIHLFFKQDYVTWSDNGMSP